MVQAGVDSINGQPGDSGDGGGFIRNGGFLYWALIALCIAGLVYIFREVLAIFRGRQSTKTCVGGICERLDGYPDSDVSSSRQSEVCRLPPKIEEIDDDEPYETYEINDIQKTETGTEPEPGNDNPPSENHVNEMEQMD
jgi:hypothetical protein